MFFLPYKLDVIEENVPWANFGLMLLCMLMFAIQSFSSTFDSLILSLVLDGWSISGLFGHMFLHGDIFHLLGNFLYLWIFGNAICARIGNAWYLLLFIGMGLVAAVAHNIVDGGLAVGASGAIYGIIGFYLAIYPTNKITCFWWIFVTGGTFEISSYILIGFWIIQDLFGLFSANSGIAHAAHLGGFIGGLILSYWLVDRGSIVLHQYSLKTLPDMIQGTAQDKN